MGATDKQLVVIIRITFVKVNLSKNIIANFLEAFLFLNFRCAKIANIHNSICRFVYIMYFLVVLIHYCNLGKREEIFIRCNVLKPCQGLPNTVKEYKT